MPKALYTATVLNHVYQFHLPHIKELKESGYEVHVAAKNDMDEEAERCCLRAIDRFVEIPFERSPLQKQNTTAYRLIKKLIKNENYDLIVCNTPVGGVLTRLAARNARKNGTKVVYIAHGFHFYKGAPLKNWLLYYPIERFLSRWTDVLVTMNQEDYSRSKSFHAKQTAFIPGIGLDVKRFSLAWTDNEKKAKREALGIPEKDIVLFSVGELIPRKNHQILLHALHIINDKRIKLVICGNGAMQSELERLAKDLQVDDQLLFLGYRRDIDELNQIADIFLLPSIHEGLSVALMEAMAAGLPVVCSVIRGNCDLIQKGKGGFLCPTDNAEAFAQAIQTLVTSPEQRRNMGAVNRKNIQNYDTSVVLKEMRQIMDIGS